MIPAKILVVDDEAEMERLIRQRLRKQIRGKEFEVVFARDGNEALDKLKTEDTIDMVLTDINMPGMDGLTLLDKLSDLDRHLKAVVVSAYGDMQNIRTAMNRGAFDFLTKPIDFDDLLITINKTINAVRQIKENLKQLQDAQLQLVQQEKMATLGQLVAGVAHEINNPVGFIFGNLNHAESYVRDLIELLELYQNKFPNPGEEIEAEIEEVELEFLLEDLPKLLASMKQGTNRIAQISKSMRTFSRSDVDRRVEFNLHEGLDSTLLILKHRLKASDRRPAIKVEKNYGDLPKLEGYPGQLNQVFMNLLANAIDALEERYQQEPEFRPMLTLTTAIASDGRWITIEIADNGIGMTGEIKAKIFDGLFTTKPVGKGTGLGLSISRQIVIEKHGGQIEFISKLGEGTTFTIALPRG